MSSVSSSSSSTECDEAGKRGEPKTSSPFRRALQLVARRCSSPAAEEHDQQDQANADGDCSAGKGTQRRRSSEQGQQHTADEVYLPAPLLHCPHPPPGAVVDPLAQLMASFAAAAHQQQQSAVAASQAAPPHSFVPPPANGAHPPNGLFPPGQQDLHALIAAGLLPPPFGGPFAPPPPPEVLFALQQQNVGPGAVSSSAGGGAPAQHFPLFPLDPGALAAFQPFMMPPEVRRKNATREVTAPLKHWLHEHRKNPYPTKAEKTMLAIITKMTMTQVSTWFANARRRLKKENKMTWSPRNRANEDDDLDEEDEEEGPNSNGKAPPSATADPTTCCSSPEQEEQSKTEGGRKAESGRTAGRIWSIAQTLDGEREHTPAPESECGSASEEPQQNGELAKRDQSPLGSAADADISQQALHHAPPPFLGPPLLLPPFPFPAEMASPHQLLLMLAAQQHGQRNLLAAGANPLGAAMLLAHQLAAQHHKDANNLMAAGNGAPLLLDQHHAAPSPSPAVGQKRAAPQPQPDVDGIPLAKRECRAES